MTSTAPDTTASHDGTPEHLDVLIVGAGISGIGVARYLTVELPETSFALLEAREASGGTWDLFRYPGIRSDSDLHTFGYEFKPWRDKKSIASAEPILDYLRDTASEYGIDEKIRYHHKVQSAEWSSETARWTVHIERGDTGETTELTCSWIFSASGYYRYDEGFTPHFEGRERFTGPVIHPQHWPEDLDWTGKKVVVIGSGATAVTLVPAMAEKAELVTMLQRTPTYIMPVPSEDPLANWLPKVVGADRAYKITRRKNILQQSLVWKFCQRFPDAARKVIRTANAKRLPEGFDVDTHFNPPYDPWTQRLCAVPDGDLFKSIREGKADVATAHIKTFTETGIELENGEHLDADIIITATGLNLLPFGGLEMTVDGEKIDLPDHVAFRGMMLSDIPNYAYAIGYTNSSWTLKVGLLCEHFCRVLAHMQENDLDICVPHVDDPEMPRRPFLDFAAGYVQRSIDLLPKQGPDKPWLMSMSYATDVEVLRKGDVEHPELHFSKAGSLAKAVAS